MAFAFRDDDSLRVVLTSGLCPPEVQARPAHVGRDEAGRIIVAPTAKMPARARAALAAAGVATDAELPADAREVRCWAEAIELERLRFAAADALPAVVLLACESVVDIAAELLRLGCDRQELHVTAADGRGYLRAIDPPTYTLMRALDPDGGVVAYAPDPPGQSAVWTELPFRHPLASKLQGVEGELVLVGRTGWRTLPDAGWQGLEVALELAVADIPAPHVPGQLAARRRIELRLAAGRREAASLWVVRRDAIATLDRLLAYLPEEIVARLAFAATEDPDPIIVIRSRTTRGAPPELALPAEVEMYAPLVGLTDVYAPVHARVEPPLRRDRLLDVIGARPAHVTWLAPMAHATGPFRVERIADAAFSPLGEWAEYVVHASSAELVPWERAATFDFGAYVSTGTEWASGPRRVDPDPETPAPRRRANPPEARPRTEVHATLPPEPAAATAVSMEPVVPAVPAEPAELDAELATLEAAFLALDEPADAPARLALFAQLGAAYHRRDRRRDAGLCFARAAWVNDSPAQATAVLHAWLAADLGTAPTTPALAAALAAALGAAQPSVELVRRVAAITAHGTAAVSAAPHRIQRWLDDHDTDLDTRSTWLARVALATLAGGDALGLASARDRILARLVGGLPVDRELPAFLRVAGRAGALGHATGDQLVAALERVAQAIATTRRSPSPVEAPPALTGAYVSFVLAHGFARLGQLDRVRALVTAAQGALGPVNRDPVHAYLAAAFDARVQQALAGQVAATPLPDALGPQLEGLDRMARYKVDRLREASQILEPLERPDPIGAFARHQRDSRGAEFATLRKLPDADARAAAVTAVIAQAAAASGDERARLLDGAFDVLLALPEAHAAPLLSQAWPLIAALPPARRAALYGEALFVAGHFARLELVPPLLAALGPAIGAVPGPDLVRVLDQSLRALRRIGLRDEMAALLAEAERTLAPGAAQLRGRIAIAGGLAFLGDLERALPILAHGLQALREPHVITARLELVRALAGAYAQAPVAHALAGIAELTPQLATVTDIFGTNSHYCLAVIHFVESLVLGITSDDLALGEAGRRFIEDDEHLIRRRLHHDLGGHA